MFGKRLNFGHLGTTLLPNGGFQFLYLSKLVLAAIVLWIVTLVVRQVNYVKKFNDPPVVATNDNELFLDISQTVDLPFQQDLSLTIGEGIKSGDNVPNCGLPKPCATNQFAVHIFSGQSNQVYPKLCIDGKYVLDRGLNGCGRGINLVVIDNVTRSIQRVSNFDTYAKDSQPLEELLLTLRVGDIVMMITFDESTSKLSKIARLLLHDIGSNWAQNLMYRSSWYIITQKGINGYTPYENIHLPRNGGWAEPHEIRLCVPLQIKGLTVHPDPIVDRNPQRIRFCEKYMNEFPLFCEGDVVNDPLIPARILKYLPISNEIMRTPIIVLTAHSYAQNVYLPLTLETIVRQPGITPRNVIVFYNAIECPTIGLLAELFDFMSNELSDVEMNLDEVLRTTELLFPDSKAYILIDMNTILAPDFIPFMGQLLPFLLTNSSDIEAISAWNDNSFANVSNDSDIIYRADAKHYRPRFAAMFKRGFKFNITNNFLWSFKDYPIGKNVIIPDVSRVLYINHQSMNAPDEVKEFSLDFMQRKRSINKQEEVLLKIHEIGDSSDIYAKNIIQMLNKSKVASDLEQYERFTSNTNSSSQSLSIYCDDALQCRHICAGLGLANCLPQVILPNIGGVIRFSKRNGPNMFLVNKTFK